MNLEEHLILHGLAIKNHATAEEVADAVGTSAGQARAILNRAVSTGRVADLGGSYTLLPAARIMLRGEYSRHYATPRNSPDFQAAYKHFEKANQNLKTIITAWQVRELPGGESMPNDHSDPDYDAKVIDRLGSLHERFEPILAQMVIDVPRLNLYARKLDRALELAEQGDVRWVSDVKLASYHTVWFELHEDLLCVLGKTRLE